MEKGDDKSPKAFDSNYGNQQPPPPYPGQQYPPQGYSEGQGYPQQQYAPMPNVQYSQGQGGNAVTYQPSNVMYVQNVGPLTDPPSDHLCFSILVTLCCCWPIGIFAILKSVATRDAIARGDRNAADENSRLAKKLSVIGLCIGILFTLISIGIMAFYLVAVFSQLNEHGDFDD